MKYIATLFLLITICACKQKRATEAELRAASAKQYTAADQNRVFADINFGMTQAQFGQLYERYLRSKNCDSACTIGQFEYYRVQPKFKQGKLYHVEFANEGSHYNGYDKSIPDLVKAAYESVKKEYGEPQYAYPLTAWKPGAEFIAYKWLIGEKTILIIVNQIDVQFGVKLVIYKLTEK